MTNCCNQAVVCYRENHRSQKVQLYFDILVRSLTFYPVFCIVLRHIRYDIHHCCTLCSTCHAVLQGMVADRCIFCATSCHLIRYDQFCRPGVISGRNAASSSSRSIVPDPCGDFAALLFREFFHFWVSVFTVLPRYPYLEENFSTCLKWRSSFN